MDHHYIPQFYLRPWLGADHKLQEFRRGYGGRIQFGRYGTKVTGFEKNLYRVPGVTPATQHNVERLFMGMVDTRAADVRDMLLQGHVPNQPHLRHSWARFISSLLLRHPDSIHTFKERYRRDFNASNPRLQARYEEIKKEGFPDTLEEFLTLRDPTMLEREAIITVAKMMESEGTMALLTGMRWAVYDTSTVSRKLMTSDRPAVCTNGFGSLNGHLGLAISPTKLFLAATFDVQMDFMLKTPVGKIVRLANAAVIGQGRKYVYAVDGSNLAEVRRLMGKQDYFELVSSLK